MTELRLSDVVANAGAAFTPLKYWAEARNDWKLEYFNHFSEDELADEVSIHNRFLFRMFYRTHLKRICEQQTNGKPPTITGPDGVERPFAATAINEQQTCDSPPTITGPDGVERPFAATAINEQQTCDSPHTITGPDGVERPFAATATVYAKPDGVPFRVESTDGPISTLLYLDEVVRSGVEAVLYYENIDHHGDFGELLNQVSLLPNCKRVVILSEVDVERACYFADKLTDSLIRLLQIPHVRVVDVSRNPLLVKILEAVFPELLKRDANKVCEKLVWFDGTEVPGTVMTGGLDGELSSYVATMNSQLHKAYHAENLAKRPFRCVWTNCV